MQASWTRLPFPARSREEFFRGLTTWLGRVFYDILPERGYEVREEQIYTAFRLARALADGTTHFAEAGSGTGKSFAYLLPALCYARFRGRPVVVATATGVLQAQLASAQGDVAELSTILALQIDARQAADPGEYLCQVKLKQATPEPGRMAEWRRLRGWSRRTTTGARSEMPDLPDHLWEQVAWDPSLPCDTCKHRSTCHMMAARRHYREAGDLVITDHRLFAHDLLTRAERQETGQLPLLPAYAAAVVDEGHHLPESWQRAQGFQLSPERLQRTVALLTSYATHQGPALGLAGPLGQHRERLAHGPLPAVQRESERFLADLQAAAEPGEFKRAIQRDGAILASAAGLIRAIEALQDDLSTEEAMQEGTADELRLRAYQDRLDEMVAALSLFRSEEGLPWLEGEELWVVPRRPLTLFGPGRLSAGTPLLFSSATLEPDYMARTLALSRYERSQVGVPFNLAEQVLIYQPAAPGDEVEQAVAVIRAMRGRTLVLLNTRAELERYRQGLGLELPWQLLYEGDSDRGAMLEAFRKDRSSILVGVGLWEGVDLPGEALSCVVMPRLPFPAHDPLIRERREQAAALGEEPFLAVDLPEMLLRLKQGAGRLIRAAGDRGVLALLDRSYVGNPWAEAVEGVLPEGAARTDDLERVAAFCPLS